MLVFCCLDLLEKHDDQVESPSSSSSGCFVVFFLALEEVGSQHEHKLRNQTEYCRRVHLLKTQKKRKSKKP